MNTIHRCFETFSKRFEFYEYDQLGSYSDQPKDSTLWTTERFCEEVEQVRTRWLIIACDRVGILEMEYALKYKKT
jgi:proline iminopeptidase